MTPKDFLEWGRTFAVLSANQRKVLRLRYGFEDGAARTLAEVAKVMNISRERVRQIEARAIDKIDTVMKYEKEKV
jgi:RNA polymerase sigma factor (sigma-70 family)